MNHFDETPEDPILPSDDIACEDSSLSDGTTQQDDRVEYTPMAEPERVWGSAYLGGPAIPPPASPPGQELSIVTKPYGYQPAVIMTKPLQRSRGRRLLKALFVLCLLAGVGTGGFFAFKTLVGSDGEYLDALAEGGFSDLFASPKAAVGHAKRLCEKFDAGEDVEGYASEKIAVEHYCDEYLDAFIVIPTEEERAEAYYGALSKQQLTSHFSSQNEAIQAAKKFCNELESGEPARGMPADLIAVEHYCDEYSDGFKVLEHRTITGTFELWDLSFSRYYSSIAKYGSSCSGDGGYSDIGSSTSVIVTSGSGEVLARTTLGRGEGSSIRCTFTFSFDLTEGEDTYIVSVGRRGDSEYTWSEIIQDDAIELTLGL